MIERLRAAQRPLTYVTVGLVVVLLAVGAYVLISLTSSKTAVAYFKTAQSIYPKDRVQIVGVDVGEIEKIEPEPNDVKITFSYDSKYTLPADATAAVMSPTLVSTRFLQVGPILQGNGPALPDGGVIPLEHTKSPLEFDDLKTQVTDLARSLGPTAQDPQGSLSRFLQVAAANGQGGNGARFNQTVKDASAALQTLADGRQDFFGTISNLQVFITGLAQVDDQVTEFNSRLASVSGTLADNDTELQQALASVDRAAGLVNSFVAENKGPLTKTVSETGQVLQGLAAKRDVIAQVLHVGPSTLLNLWNIQDTKTSAFRGTLVVDNLNTPADLVCTAIANAGPIPSADAQQECGTVLGPTLNLLRQQNPPIGINPIDAPNTAPANPGVPDTTNNEQLPGVVPNPLGGN
ncbi:MCE family protein [Actinomycetospora sp. TBRC 11914]|uniref:MCE family protein n=1 Tax=Actinomycetospora sp. TBRC 11914 TaxID=2729387 RepID=UPI00145D4142|nr:MCE family protein [Actinomycetospora sp. TBRC 11914]NMO91619.1 MCE family protein [Actinomycetospora sp. TBRC 11914]